MSTKALSIMVTGGAGALGSAVARHLVSKGNLVAGVDVARAEARLVSLKDELGDRFLGVVADLSNATGWERTLEEVQSKLGDVDGAVLTVGGWAGGAPLAKEAEGAFTRMIEANLVTVHLALRALLPGMVERKRGSIVVIGSRAVQQPWSSAGAASYAASKAGAVTLAQAAAQEVLEAGVRINAVLPSVIDTPANRAAMPGADASRWVPAESLARTIAFLLSEDSAAISGAAIPVYGRA
ncbi:MAG: SDR family NAD(P)-dependent oxidoreductase [Polyangiaceae bacterium]